MRPTVVTAGARHLATALALLAATSASTAWSQTVYRFIGPDGRPVFSDQPPPATLAAPVTGAAVPAPTQPALPFALREVVSRYPVTLYAAGSCDPCAAGRSFLNGRGIPFSERSISSNEDALALQQLTGDATVPVLTIGSQHLRGFSEITWGQYLDAAGYPARSALPAGYRNPPPSPLVAVQGPAVPAPAPASPPPAEPPAPRVPDLPPAPAPSPDNPAGIRF